MPEHPLVHRQVDSDRPDLFGDAPVRLGFIERLSIAIVRGSFSWRPVDRVARWLQRNVGARWIHACISRLLDVQGLDRLPALPELGSFILVSNHRSYFDLFVISAVLFRAGLRNRLMYPVRSKFFYDHPLGLLVNLVMSFWSMYPPIFRDKRRPVLNPISLAEVTWHLKHQGLAAGLHPEGTRKKDGDPYTLLPAQSGVGRLVHETRVPVIPAFINGLGNGLLRQVVGNFRGKGERVIIVFGSPIEYGDLLEQSPGPKTYHALADRTLEVVHQLGQEERALRAEHSSGPRARM